MKKTMKTKLKKKQQNRKHILLKNEIEMIQIFLRGEAFPSEKYKQELANRLEDLKRLWYKTKSRRKNVFRN